MSSFISIGSNLGERVGNCRRAIALLRQGAELIKTSPFYETPPWGRLDQPPFINCAVEVETRLDARALLARIKDIERAMGRGASLRWGPRIIDLDIIFFDSEVINSTELSVPHPLMQERAFVLRPLADIAPDFKHPVLNKTVSQLLRSIHRDQITALSAVKGPEPALRLRVHK